MLLSANAAVVDNLNSLPCILLALTLVMVVTWLIYGRYHFIGPVRAFAKWTTGIDIDFTTARGRSVAIEEYIRRQTTRTPSIPRSGFALSSIFRGRSEKPVPEVPPTATWPRSPIPEIDISDATGLKSAPAAAEPQLLPSNTRRIASRIGKIDEEHSIPMQPLSPTQSLTFVVPETGRGSETGGGGGGRNGRSKRKSPPEHTSRIGTVSVLDALPESQLDPTATLDIHELRSLQFPRHYN
jgi:hypothetical protein